MQKLLEKKNKKTKKRKSPPQLGRLASWPPCPPMGLGPPQPAGPAPRIALPSLLFPRCAPLQGRVAARPPRRQRRGLIRAPPLDASTSSPPTSTHASNPPSPSPPLPLPLLRSGEEADAVATVPFPSSRPPAAPRPLTLSVSFARLDSFDWRPPLEPGSTAAAVHPRPHLRLPSISFDSGDVSTATKPPRATVRAAR